jgi:hypothetical protein
MSALRELNVSGCEQLAADCLSRPRGQTRRQSNGLPAAIAPTVVVLDASHSSISSLPEGMSALRELNVSGCKLLCVRWLPNSIAARIVMLDARNSSMVKLPPGMVAVVTLGLSDSIQRHLDTRVPVKSEQVNRLVGSGLTSLTCLKRRQAFQQMGSRK